MLRDIFLSNPLTFTCKVLNKTSPCFGCPFNVRCQISGGMPSNCIDESDLRDSDLINNGSVFYLYFLASLCPRCCKEWRYKRITHIMCKYIFYGFVIRKGDIKQSDKTWTKTNFVTGICCCFFGESVYMLMYVTGVTNFHTLNKINRYIFYLTNIS